MAVCASALKAKSEKREPKKASLRRDFEVVTVRLFLVLAAIRTRKSKMCKRWIAYVKSVVS